MDLLKQFSEESINAFSKDLTLLMNTVKHIDEAYADGHQEFEEDMKRFGKLLELWNKKYPQVLARHSEDGMQMKLQISIKEKDIQALVSVASNIDNLKSINRKDIMMGEGKLEDYIPKSAKSVEISYSPDEGEEENTLNFEMKSGEIILVYDFKDMLSKDSPEFKICCYYALANSDGKVNIQKMSTFFSFDTDFDEQEGKGEGYLNRVRLFDKR